MEASQLYKMKTGERAIDFTLPATDGKDYTLAHFRSPVLVLLFSCNHCPYVIAYEDRIIAFAKKYKRKADVVAINSNEEKGYPEDSFSNMAKRAKEKGFTFTYLRDEDQVVAKHYGAMCTPHFFVFDKNRVLQYQGRFDDNWQNAAAARSHDLRDAVDALLAGKPVANPVTRAVGCSIKWRHQ